MRIVLAIAATLMLSTNVFAGVLLEPYLGYESGTFKGNVGGVAAFKIAGSQFGAKVGYSVMGFGVGVDYSMAGLKADDTTTAATDLDLKCTDLGAFVQFQFPAFIKVSATYFLDSKIASETGGSDLDFKGKGFKVGIGFTSIPFIAINLDLISEKYDDVKLANVAIAAADIDRASLMLSISAPFNF